ncbi:MAG: hypothetical protein ACREBU_09240, partial [Nitrososphaera sp.]
MAIIFANNVRSQLTTAANSSVASLVVTAGVSPFVTPPDPSQSSGLCYLTITDNLALPTRTEVVTYTGRTGAGPFTLTGVRRGQEGTVSESWAAGATVFQSWTARPAREIQEPRVNALMNSDFRIWQRGTDQSNFTGKRWTADRWRAGLITQGTWSARLVEAQSTVPDFTAVNSLLTYRNVLTVRVADAVAPAAGDIVALQQFIEGNAYRRFARKEKVASFWVRANRTGTFGFSLQEGVSSVSFINTF